MFFVRIAINILLLWSLNSEQAPGLPSLITTSNIEAPLNS
jgi:hypothetical protein